MANLKNPFFFFFMIVCLPLAGFSQEQSGITRFQISQGTQFIFDSQQAMWNVANPLDENSVFHLFPGKSSGVEIINATIVEDGQITRIYAGDITYEMANQSFLLKQNARIVQSENEINGPVKIEFDSSTNKMVAVGTNQHPASFKYVREDGSRIFSSALQFIFEFEEQDGDRRLVNILAEGNKSLRFLELPDPQDVTHPLPKLSPP